MGCYLERVALLRSRQVKFFHAKSLLPVLAGITRRLERTLSLWYLLVNDDADRTTFGGPKKALTIPVA